MVSEGWYEKVLEVRRPYRCRARRPDLAGQRRRQAKPKPITKQSPKWAKWVTAPSDERLRVAGDVKAVRSSTPPDELNSSSVQDKMQLKVAYTGSEPLPDTFRDGAQALADGKMGRDGVFHASKIQAKCASKYEAKPGQLRRCAGLPSTRPRRRGKRMENVGIAGLAAGVLRIHLRGHRIGRRPPET